MKSEAIISKSWFTNFKSKISLSRLPKGETCPWPLPAPGIDYFLLFSVLALVVYGLIMVYSASFIYAQEKTGDGLAFIQKQLAYATLGFGGMLAVCRIDYRKWRDWSHYALLLITVLLVMVLIPGVGTKVLGAQRWIKLGPVGFQPGELAKVILVMFTAAQLDRKKDRLDSFVAGIVSPVLLAIPALFLLLIQPDFGSTVMIVGTIFALMFLAGVSKKYLGLIVGSGLVGGVALAMGSAYRRDRILSYLDPWRDPLGKGFQLLQSFVGLHHGSFFGVGLGNGKEKLFYLPEAHNDFIFSVIGEELGFIGVAVTSLAYLYFIYRGLKIGWNCKQRWDDTFGLYLASGITLLLGLQAFTNMAVVLGLVPTKGLALPFISYGGSALLVDLLAVGILLSIARGPQGPQSRVGSLGR